MNSTDSDSFTDALSPAPPTNAYFTFTTDLVWQSSSKKLCPQTQEIWCKMPLPKCKKNPGCYVHTWQFVTSTYVRVIRYRRARSRVTDTGGTFGPCAAMVWWQFCSHRCLMATFLHPDIAMISNEVIALVWDVAKCSRYPAFGDSNTIAFTRHTFQQACGKSTQQLVPITMDTSPLLASKACMMKTEWKSWCLFMCMRFP